MFNTTIPNVGLAFFLTALGGNPFIFVSTQVSTPGWGNATWEAIGFGDEIVTISTSDPSFQNAPATYYVGVYGAAENCSFTITAVQTTPTYTIALSEGQPQAGQSPAHSFSYFTFQVPYTTPLNPITVVASPTINDVDIYVSTVASVFPTVYCVTPDPNSPSGCDEYAVTTSTYNFSSVQSQQMDFLSLPPSALVPGQTIIIGVLATTMDAPNGVAPPSTFNVIAASSNGIIELPNGVAVGGVVGAAESAFYKFPVVEYGTDIVVSASTFAGTYPPAMTTVHRVRCDDIMPRLCRRIGLVRVRYNHLPGSG